jgi:hypothetical protein
MTPGRAITEPGAEELGPSSNSASRISTFLDAATVVLAPEQTLREVELKQIPFDVQLNAGHVNVVSTNVAWFPARVLDRTVNRSCAFWLAGKPVPTRRTRPVRLTISRESLNVSSDSEDEGHAATPAIVVVADSGSHSS